MFRKKLSHRLAGLSMTVFIASCTLGGNTFAESPAVKPLSAFSSDLSYQMYHTMAAEMMMREGMLKEAAQHYAAVATRSNDPAIVRRATETAIQAQEPALAKKLLSHWLELEPDSVEVRQYRILLRSRLQEYDEALEDVVWVRDYIQEEEGNGFEFVVSLLALEAGVNSSYEIFRRYAEQVEDSPKVQLVVASLAVNSDHFTAALEAGEKVKETGNQEQKEQATRLRARAFMGLQRRDEAVDEFATIAKDSDDNALRLEYGRMLVMAERHDEARPFFKQMYADQPDNEDILYTLGLLYLDQQEYAFAEPLMKKLLKVPGRKHEASYFLGQIYEGQARLSDALAAYEDALSGEFDREAISRKTALLKRERGVDAALSWLDGQMEGSNVPMRELSLLMAKANVLHEAKQYAQAIEVYNTAEQYGLSRRNILYARSLTYDRMGELSKAEEDLQAILEDNPEDADALNALGYMLTIGSTRYQEAKELISKALALDPDSAPIIDSMGWVMYKLGELEAAEVHLRRAFAMMPDPEVASHLIEVLSKLGKHEEAETLLKDMLAKYPDDEMLADIETRLSEWAGE